MLVLACNNSCLSKDMASLGFTSVSSPWEVVYYFLPGITGQSQGSSLGSRIIGFCQNTTSVPGLAAGLVAVGCCPWGSCRWGWRDTSHGYGAHGAAGCCPQGCCQWGGGMQDAAEQQGKQSPWQCELCPRLLSGGAREKTVGPFSGLRYV